MNIVDFIGRGKENAVTRQFLCTLLNLPDRTVRKCIADARDRGVVILNSQDGAGYYMSDDPGELKRQYNQNRSLALSILRQQKYIEREIDRLAGPEQMRMEETV